MGKNEVVEANSPHKEPCELNHEMEPLRIMCCSNGTLMNDTRGGKKESSGPPGSRIFLVLHAITTHSLHRDIMRM